MSEQTSNSNVSSESTSEASTSEVSVETQQVETSQSTEQVDTAPSTSEVNQDLGITEKVESETSTEQKSIHDLVEAHMNGELSEEDLKLIEENGLGEYLNDLAEVRQLRIERNDQEVISVVGSKESYQELQEWGSNNLSADEQQAFNEALFSGNMNLAKLAVQGLKARYEAANGKAPERVIEAGSSVNADSRPYSSVTEYINETQSFEYKRNPEYRAKVEARRNLSGF